MARRTNPLKAQLLKERHQNLLCKFIFCRTIQKFFQPFSLRDLLLC